MFLSFGWLFVFGIVVFAVFGSLLQVFLAIYCVDWWWLQALSVVGL